MITTGVVTASHYHFKPGPYSSHSLLVRQFPSDGRGLRVLDAGCAGGYLSQLLAARGFHVTAIDLPSTDLPSTDLPGAPPPEGVEFIAADLNHGLPPLSRRFDYILCADVLEHLRDPLVLLNDCRDALAEGGAFIASLPNSGHAFFRANVLLGRFPQDDRGLFDRTHLHFYTWDGWVELLQRAGFRVDGVAGSCTPIGLALPRWDGSLAVRALERVSFELARVWKRLFAYQFIVRAHS